MAKRIEYKTGAMIGTLEYIREIDPYIDPKSNAPVRKAIFRCSCGTEFECMVGSVRSGNTISCGCAYKRYFDAGNHPGNYKHGMAGTRIHATWTGMRERCNRPSCPAYEDYGGRGIKISSEWDEFLPFYNYVSKLPHYGEEGRSIDRIDNDGNYEPGNVRWATAIQQNNNRRPFRRYSHFQG